MFRKKPQPLGSILDRVVREDGLETPLLQKRVVDMWDDAAGAFAARHTTEKYIKNQTLVIRVDSPALRSDLSMRRAALVGELNRRAGAFVISDIRIY